MQRYLFIAALFAVCFAYAQSPYISHVWEYSPAPGQFVNELPEYDSGDDAESMRQKAEDAIAYNNGSAVTLGGWGGYIVFGFDHEVPNVPGQSDLLIRGNAFYADINHPENGGSSEPGVVYVSRDANGNGRPDDTWYELAGSEYAASDRNYRLTYFRPSPDHAATPNMAEDLTDTTYIFWRDINGATGYIAKNRYHTQPYYPQWQEADRLVFNGTLLPPNAQPYQEDGHTKYILYNFAYGYADNHPNTASAAALNIDWAVNSQGRPAGLTGIHFVKVQSGTHQQCGWIGEISTEVTGAADLHLLNGTATGLQSGVRSQETGVRNQKVLRNGQLIIVHDGCSYTILGLRQ